MLFTNDITLRKVRSHIEDDLGLIARQAKNTSGQKLELVNAMTQDIFK